MKKIFIFLFFMILSLALCACKEEEEQSKYQIFEEKFSRDEKVFAGDWFEFSNRIIEGQEGSYNRVRMTSFYGKLDFDSRVRLDGTTNTFYYESYEFYESMDTVMTSEKKKIYFANSQYYREEKTTEFDRIEEKVIGTNVVESILFDFSINDDFLSTTFFTDFDKGLKKSLYEDYEAINIYDDHVYISMNYPYDKGPYGKTLVTEVIVFYFDSEYLITDLFYTVTYSKLEDDGKDVAISMNLSVCEPKDIKIPQNDYTEITQDELYKIKYININ